MNWNVEELILSPSPGAVLRELREQAKLRQREVAEALGVTPTTISDVERGRRPNPGIMTVRNIVLAMRKLHKEREESP